MECKKFLRSLYKLCSVQIPYTSVDIYDFSTLYTTFPHDLIKQNLNIWLIGLSKILDVSPIPIKPAQGSGCKSLIPKGYGFDIVVSTLHRCFTDKNIYKLKESLNKY